MLRTRHAAIIGGGIAGCATASALCDEGWKVTLIESARELATEASGNPLGLLCPYLGTQSSMSELYSEAFTLALTRVNEFHAKDILSAVNFCGALQLPSTERLETLIASASSVPHTEVINSEKASELFGTQIASPCLYVPQATVVSPPRLCDAHVKSCGKLLSIILETEVFELQYADTTWKLTDIAGKSITEADIVIVANSFRCSKFPQTRFLKVEPVKGQIAVLSSGGVLDYKMALCFDGYFLPGERPVLGATFEHGVTSWEASLKKHEEIFSRASKWIPHFKSYPTEAAEMRASFRASTHDRFPYVGAIPKENGLFVSVGHGSRGLLSAHLGASIIKKLIRGETLIPIERLLSPERLRPTC